MFCDIVTPEKMLCSEECVFVSAPAAEGEIGFLEQCSPLMSTLRPGEVRIKAEDNAKPQRIAVAGGYLECDGHKVVVLANHALEVSAVDPAICNERIAKNEALLAAAAEDDSRSAFYKDEIAWQKLLLELSSK